MKWLIPLFIVMIVSCTSKKSIDVATGLEVVFYNNGDTLTHNSTNDTLLKHFRQVLNGRVEKLPACKPIGEVDFYKNDELLYTVWVTEISNECSHLFVGTKAWRTTYNIGRYMSELYNDLKNGNE